MNPLGILISHNHGLLAFQHYAPGCKVSTAHPPWFSAQRKAVQSLVVAQVTKYRFHYCKSARDHLSAYFRIHYYLHPVGVIFLNVSFAL